jgi:hydrogenase nickel incorporation protein HypA/HybF
VHELSICRAIVGIVGRHAQGRPVRTVHVRVGQLRQIVPDTLVYCWSLVTDGTGLGGSELAVESVGLSIRCHGCDHTATLDAPLMICPECGGSAVTVLTGEEFLITTLDLAEA